MYKPKFQRRAFSKKGECGNLQYKGDVTTLGDAEEHRILVRCSLWGHKESDVTE